MFLLIFRYVELGDPWEKSYFELNPFWVKIVKNGVKQMSKVEIKRIYPEELAEFSVRHRESEYLLVDVRQPQEYTQEHIPGAKFIPLHELEGRLGELDPGKQTVFYCRSGKRSMAAAVLAMDSGIFDSDILNLEGGINAYQNRMLPDYPKVDIFSGSSELETVVSRAVTLEKGAEKFYNGFQERIKDENLKNQLQKLAGLEKAHARVIFAQGKHLFEEDFDSFFSKADDSIVEGGLNVSDWVQKFQYLQQSELCLYFLEVALEIEAKAYDMYRNLAETKDYPRETSECFFRLSEQEKGHMRLVARLFKDCV
jgi:sulfur-carrier protein adenylyltransferase/sulfurtransferase